jgi:hypothetical protein
MMNTVPPLETCRSAVNAQHMPSSVCASVTVAVDGVDTARWAPMRSSGT